MATTIQIRDSRIDSREMAAGNNFVVDSTTAIRASNSNRSLFDSSCRRLENRTLGSIENYSPKHGCSGLRSVTLGSTSLELLSEDFFSSSFIMGNSALLKPTYFY